MCATVAASVLACLWARSPSPPTCAGASPPPLAAGRARGPGPPHTIPAASAGRRSRPARCCARWSGRRRSRCTPSSGFIRVGGRRAAGYGYLLYPHRSIVAFDERSGALLNEYCVGFPDSSDPAAGTRLPDSDDVLAKWMALHGDERRLIADANMHLPGRHVDPGQVRRDLRRLRAWEGRRRRVAQ